MNLWADVSTSKTSTRVLQTMVIGMLASVIVIRLLLLISGDVEENPGPLSQGEVAVHDRFTDLY